MRRLVRGLSSDQEILHALGRGEPAGIAALYQLHGARMIAFARRYVIAEGPAEDIVAGLLGRWLEHPPRVRDADRLAGFLATSVYHAAVDWMRRERAEQGQPPRAPDPSVGRRAAPRVALEEMRTRLAAALERLSDAERTLLEGHYGRAMTADECMEILAISRPAFHQRLHRARQHLAELLG